MNELSAELQARRDLFHYTETRWWLKELDRLVDEANIVFTQLVQPIRRHEYDNDPFNLTLRAYVTHCFSWIDLASRSYSQAHERAKRMEGFMVRYMHLDGRAAHAAVS